MRKLLGKLGGGAIARPFPHAVTLFLLISASVFLALPEAANAQVWVSSGFKAGSDAQHITAYCSTSAVDPNTGQTSPAATDYAMFSVLCYLTTSTGQTIVVLPYGVPPPYSIDGLGHPITWGYGVLGNPTALSSIEIQTQMGVTYTIHSYHQLNFIQIGIASPCPAPIIWTMNVPPYTVARDDCSLDPEGFWSMPPVPVPTYGPEPNYSTTSTSIAKEVTGSMTGTGTYNVILDWDPAYNYLLWDGGPWPIATTSAVYTSCPTPKLTTMSPKTWFAGKSYPVTITGTGFTTSANATASCPVTPVAAKVASGSSASLTNVTVVSPTQITFTVEPAASDPTGNAAITVGSSSNGGQFSVRTQILGNQIQWNGKTISTTDGSTPPTKNAIVGQKIALTTPTLPAGITANTTTWTVGGTNIGNYLPGNGANSVPQTTLANSSLTTYWINAGTDIPVTYQYCADASVPDVGGQCSPIATASFTVTAPTGGSIGVAHVGTVGIQQMNGSPYLQFGTVYATNAGVLFTPSATAPPGSTNNFTWAQLLSMDTMSLNGSSCSFLPDAGPDLDNVYPADPVPGTNNFGDGPYTQLLPTDTLVTRTFNAQTYLLWNSGLSDAISVPIGSVAWNFSGQATNSGTSTTPKWTASGTGNAGSFVPSASQPYYGYPIWTMATANATCYPIN
jgi:hypothetical protein